MTRIIRTLTTAVALAPLLAACGSDASGGSGGALMFPTCTSAQVITRDANGNLVCTSLPAGTVTLPSPCTASQGLTSDGTTLSCAPLSSMTTNDTMLMTELTTINQQVQNFGTQITSLGGKAGAKPLYVGNTTVTTVGKITFAGVSNGLPAATATCNAQYPGSRMCTVYDMYNSDVAGKFTVGTPVPRAWVFAANWKYPMAPLPTGSNTPWDNPPVNSNATSAGGPQEGLADNCGSYTYPTANRTWTGVAAEYNQLQTGDWGLKFHSGAPYSDGTAADAEPGAPCNGALPIACCK